MVRGGPCLRIENDSELKIGEAAVARTRTFETIAQETARLLKSHGDEWADDKGQAWIEDRGAACGARRTSSGAGDFEMRHWLVCLLPASSCITNRPPAEMLPRAGRYAITYSSYGACKR